MLYNGVRLWCGETSDEQYAEIERHGDLKSPVYRQLRQLRDSCADEIRARFPGIPRRVSGYNLDSLLPEHGFDVAGLLVGSESTLVTVCAPSWNSCRSSASARLSSWASPASTKPRTPFPRSCPTSRSRWKAWTHDGPIPGRMAFPARQGCVGPLPGLQGMQDRLSGQCGHPNCSLVIRTYDVSGTRPSPSPNC
jgi:hypothetical protein